jgi:hypothetical protein
MSIVEYLFFGVGVGIIAVNPRPCRATVEMGSLLGRVYRICQ